MNKLMSLIFGTGNNSHYQVDPTMVARLMGHLPQHNPDSPDYNTQAYVNKYGEPDQSKGQHLTDEFKLPNHMTFSDQSSYSNPYDMQGGAWQRGGSPDFEKPDGTIVPTKYWNFAPSQFNMTQHSPNELAKYFTTRENKGTYLTLPEGRIVQGGK